MNIDRGDSITDLPEADEIFRRYLRSEGVHYIKRLESAASTDVDLRNIEPLSASMGTLAAAYGRMSQDKLNSLSIFNMTEFGLPGSAVPSLALVVSKLDIEIRMKRKEIPLDSFEPSYETYDDDFEDLSSPEKSDTTTVVSDLETDKVVTSKPPKVSRDPSNDGRVPTKGVTRKTSPSRTRDREWISRGNWTLGEKIGSGSFGEVFKGLNNSGKLFAVKRMRIPDGRSEELLNLANEIDLMRNMSHPNIVSYIGTKVIVICTHIFKISALIFPIDM